jgi:hypothetical protein
MPEPEYIKKSGLDEAIESDLSTGLDEEYFDYYAGSANKRIKLVEIFKKALGIVSGGVRPIGTNVDGAFVTTNASQDVSNKDLIDCKINGGDVLTVTSSDINKLAGITEEVAALITNLDSAVGVNASDISNLQTDVGTLSDNISTNVKMYSIIKTFEAEKPIILSTDIDASHKIDHLSIIAKMYKVSGTTQTEEATTGLVITKKTVAIDILDKITFPEVTGDYNLVIYYTTFS